MGARVATVVIADDDASVREALAALLAAQVDLDVVGVAASGGVAATLCAEHRPTIALVDVMMPMGGRAAIEAIRAVSPSTRVVVYTARADRRTRAQMLEAGAVDVLVKGGGRDVVRELVTVARRWYPVAPELPPA
jgi:DNA-binding NarL/FixJ family response regulator